MNTAEFAVALHGQKHRTKDETFRESQTRVSTTLADNEQHRQRTERILWMRRFLPAGRVQAAIGSKRGITPYNCFVSGNIQDSFVDGDGSIMHRATQAAATMRLGGGIGYGFGSLRPRNALIKKLGSRSSGPLPFMGIFDAVCKCVASAGDRRGAQMGIVPVWHPDIVEFIEAKIPPDWALPIMEMREQQIPGSKEWSQWDTALQKILPYADFNFSVGITDKFMEAVQQDADFVLEFEGKVYETVRANMIWDKIMDTTWDWAEPGVVFLDRMNALNNLWYCETILATNPCGEQPLPAFGACLLGSFNLVKYLSQGQAAYAFDMDAFVADIPDVVRMMDNVVDNAIFPLPEQEVEAKSKRRMGLGLTGVANTLEALGTSYGDKKFCSMLNEIMATLTNEAYRASALLAREKGSFPLFDYNLYSQGEFFQRLDRDVQDLIKLHGLRNSHLISIAPTGSISLTAGNVSSSIEPVFSYTTLRTIIMDEGEQVVSLADYGYEVLGVQGKLAKDVTIQEHLDVLLTVAYWTDSAASKTCNVPSDMPRDEFKSVYMKAYLGGAKGITTFTTGGKRFGVLNADDTAEAVGASCSIDPSTGRKSCE